MTFLSEFEDDTANELTALGSETATYTAAGGAGVTVTPVISRQPTEREETPGGHTLFYRAIVKLATSDVAAPAVGDKINFDSRDFAVQAVTPPVGGMSELRVEATSGDERAAPGYRAPKIGG